MIPASNPYGENQFGAANKGALALNALGLMAIFNDDTELLNKVVYQTRTLAHIGLRSSNDIGMLGDYLRDQGHSHGQLKSLVMLAEALWKQGIDIYSDFDNRLLVKDLPVNDRFSVLAAGDGLQPVHAAGQAGTRRGRRRGCLCGGCAWLPTHEASFDRHHPKRRVTFEGAV